MPGNIVKINDSQKLSWNIGVSKIKKLITYLNKIGFKESDKKVISRKSS